MHTYLESIGFARVRKRSDVDRLIHDTVYHHDEKAVFESESGVVMAEFKKQYAPGMGIAVCGEVEKESNFHPEFYFPYFYGETVSTEQPVGFERHAGDESYAGACDDPRMGATIIFYLNNTAQLRRAPDRDAEFVSRPVRLSALAKEGTILIPLSPSLREEGGGSAQAERNRLLAQARGGDEKAIERLTMEELNSYDYLSRRMRSEDVFSIVESSLVPYGVECDQYSVLGTIFSCDRVRNVVTGEHIYRLGLEVCEIRLEVCINEDRVYGEPAVGRRFRGLIWLQGNVKFDRLA